MPVETRDGEVRSARVGCGELMLQQRRQLPPYISVDPKSFMQQLMYIPTTTTVRKTLIPVELASYTMGTPTYVGEA